MLGCFGCVMACKKGKKSAGEEGRWGVSDRCAQTVDLMCLLNKQVHVKSTKKTTDTTLSARQAFN